MSRLHWCKHKLVNLVRLADEEIDDRVSVLFVRADDGLKARRTAAVERSSRLHRNCIWLSTTRKSTLWTSPQSQHCSLNPRLLGVNHSPSMIW